MSFITERGFVFITIMLLFLLFNYYIIINYSFRSNSKLFFSCFFFFLVERRAFTGDHIWGNVLIRRERERETESSSQTNIPLFREI